jgi:hypothetical protein
MASAVTSAKISPNWAIKTYDHDPDATSAQAVTADGGTTKIYLPCALFELFGAACMTTVSASSSGPSLVDIVAATDSAGTNVTTVVSSGVIDADAVGDFVWLECTAAQIKEVGDAAGLTFTHFSARITCSNSGDECAVTLVRGQPKFPQANLTATAIA